MKKPLRVLFVCKANIGRSQALREFTQQHLETNSIMQKQIVVDSAGTAETIVDEIKDPAKRSIPSGLKKMYRKVWGITREMPRRKPVNRSLLEKNDIVLVAEPKLKAELHMRFPEHRDKILTVKEYLWPKLSERRQVIDDPPFPTTYRYRKMSSTMQRDVKMLRECNGIAGRLVEKWKREF